MIRLNKGSAPPNLISSGEEHAKELCAAYEKNPELCSTGEKKWTFRDHIYRSASVALDACHHGKCCYCETPLDASFEIEHWRPKSRYYWLAYSWDNLFLSCGFCNKKKGNEFPLEDSNARAMHHGMNIADERPCILKPDGDQDPNDHIKFHGDRPEGLTLLGRKTIELLGLDCPKHRGRSRHLAEIRLEWRVCKLWTDSTDPERRQQAQIARRLVEKALRPESPYSSMIAAYVEANPLPESAPASVNHSASSE